MATELEPAFKEICDLFNEVAYDKLAKRFHVNLIVKKVDDPGSVSGAQTVLEYLKRDQAPKQPQIENPVIDRPLHEHPVMGQVSGTADYRDTKVSNTTIPIQFTFTFTRSNEKDDWLIINAFQAPRINHQ